MYRVQNNCTVCAGCASRLANERGGQSRKRVQQAIIRLIGDLLAGRLRHLRSLCPILGGPIIALCIGTGIVPGQGASGGDYDEELEKYNSCKQTFDGEPDRDPAQLT